MKIRSLSKKTFDKRNQILTKMADQLMKNGDPKIKSDILEVLNDKSLKIGCTEKDIAIELVEKTKTIEAIPALYGLLNIPVVSGIGGRVQNPLNALISFGKDGLPELMKTLESEEEQSIPYQTIAAIMYHWFDCDKKSLRSCLMKHKKEASKENKTKMAGLIKVVDGWQSE